MSSCLKIGIVEDQILVLELIAELCRSRFGWEIALSATTVAAAEKAMNMAALDALLIDINLPDGDGLELGLRLRDRYPRLKIAILSAECTEYTVHRMRKSQIGGYINKTAHPDELQKALEIVFIQGGLYYSSIINTTAKKTLADAKAFTKVLSDRERELLPFLGIGLADEEISKQAAISISTVQKHRQNIMAKLRLHSQPELVRYCIEKGFVQTRPDGGIRPITRSASGS